jgi:hypothetical protein
MNRIQLVSAGVAGFLLAALPASAESGPVYRDLRSQAMGRTGVASSTGANALFLNPAALAGQEGGGMGMSLDLGLNAVLLDYADWAADNYKYLDEMDTLLTRIRPIDNKWAPFAQSLAVHGSYQDIAFALAMDTRYDLTLAEAVVTPVLGVGMLSDIVLTAGRGFQGPDGYRLGFALKYVYRLRYDRRLVGSTDEDFYTVNDILQRPDNGMGDKLDKISAASQVAEASQGAGINLGVEKDVAENWTAAVSLIDFPTVIGSRFARPDINLGLAYHDDLDLVPDLDDRIVVNLDFQRFLIPGTPWWRQVKMGAAMEAGMGGRTVGMLALGLNDGYPTFGVRFGFLLHFSYIYTAEEIGTYPGQQKLSFHKLALQLEI